MKGTFLVLRRVRGGDVDLVATLYGTAGKVSLFLREGYLNEKKLFGVFEPFNLVKIDYYQSSGLIIPRDVLEVKRFSYFAKDVKRYFLMSYISQTVLRHINFYDEELFSLILRFFLKETKNPEASYFKFFLNLLKTLGYEPLFLRERVRGRYAFLDLEKGSLSSSGVKVRSSLLNLLKKIHQLEEYERIKIKRKDFEEGREILEKFLSFHLNR
ncbi:DNA repair protein RecO [Aquifex aeolicus]|uniref:Uncharacterized protein aq_2203 n=1 Tax=Aquifex aeolicus (strain VF5) TaxID=224324 RepID=Y2203_AQUAE|nr:DNA repair protein RecO C-terminal domain-containing protein [Aquifex aeolicus]O67944.1 RecName: Full=Uncharacterized protein aq_2203 [Aquifex aeolicus VF5]AAC07907.1 putative protein [Aquifex aeolicus VF5]